MDQYKEVQEQQKNDKSSRKRRKGKQLPQEPGTDTCKKAKGKVSLHCSFIRVSEISLNGWLHKCLCTSIQDHLQLLRNATALFRGVPSSVTPRRQLQVVKGMVSIYYASTLIQMCSFYFFLICVFLFACSCS